LTQLAPFGEIIMSGRRVVMKLWFRGRDELVEQTLAFVQSVEKPVEPIHVEFPKEAIASIVDEPGSRLGSERDEIAKRVANFRAHQEKLRVQRDEYCNSVMKITRAKLERSRVD
jgi:hypothetical protein